MGTGPFECPPIEICWCGGRPSFCLAVGLGNSTWSQSGFPGIPFHPVCSPKSARGFESSCHLAVS